MQYSPVCIECNAEGSAFGSKAEAVAAWNRVARAVQERDQLERELDAMNANHSYLLEERAELRSTVRDRDRLVSTVEEYAALIEANAMVESNRPLRGAAVAEEMRRILREAREG